MPVAFSDETLGWIIRIGSATAILVIGIWLAFYLSKIVRRKATANPRIDTTLGAFFAIMVRYAIIIIVLLIVLQQFGVETTSLVAVLGASALAIGLALQGTLTNVASGIMIALMRPYQIGDHVDLNGKEGDVTDLDLFFTELTTADMTKILVPNGMAVSNPITNYTRNGERSVTLTVRVTYNADPDAPLAIMRDLITADPRVLPQPEPEFTVEELGDFAVKLQGVVRVASADHDGFRADMLKAIKQALDAAGIEIPNRGRR